MTQTGPTFHLAARLCHSAIASHQQITGDYPKYLVITTAVYEVLTSEPVFMSISRFMGRPSRHRPEARLLRRHHHPLKPNEH